MDMMARLQQELQEVIGVLCPQCAVAVQSVLDAVRAAQAKEEQAKHDANAAAADARVQAPGEAEAVLKGKS